MLSKILKVIFELLFALLPIVVILAMNILFVEDRQYFILGPNIGLTATNRVYLLFGSCIITIALWLSMVMLLKSKSSVAKFVIDKSERIALIGTIILFYALGVITFIYGVLQKGVPNP